MKPKPKKPALWTTLPTARKRLEAAAARRKAAKATVLAERRGKVAAKAAKRRLARSRTPLKRIRPQSEKRVIEDRIYAKLRKEFLSKFQYCQRPGCRERSQCVHHWAGRRSNYLKVETWKASCLICNDFAKQYPKLSRIENWIAPIGVYLT